MERANARLLIVVPITLASVFFLLFWAFHSLRYATLIMLNLPFALIGGVWLTGLMQINQMRVIEKVQQRIFARYAFAFSEKIPRVDLKKADSFYLPELVNRFFDVSILQKGLSKLLLEIPAASIQILFGLILLWPAAGLAADLFDQAGGVCVDAPSGLGGERRFGEEFADQSAVVRRIIGAKRRNGACGHRGLLGENCSVC